MAAVKENRSCAPAFVKYCVQERSSHVVPFQLFDFQQLARERAAHVEFSEGPVSHLSASCVGRKLKAKKLTRRESEGLL